jgi:hypothetical protein
MSDQRVGSNPFDKPSLNPYSQKVHETRAPIHSETPSKRAALSGKAQTHNRLPKSTMNPLSMFADRTDPLPFSHKNAASDLNVFSLIGSPRTCSSRTEAETPTQTVCVPGVCVKDAMDATVDVIAVSVGGTIGGLLLAVIVAVTLIIVVQRNRRRSEAIDEESSADIDMVETMSSFRGSGHYVSQENTDQIRTEEVIRLSRVAE